MHKLYKADIADETKQLFKEFRGVPGVRPDFVDLNTRTIYELKPNNPNAIKRGQKQLERYKKAFEEYYPGETWHTVLDTY